MVDVNVLISIITLINSYIQQTRCLPGTLWAVSYCC